MTTKKLVEPDATADDKRSRGASQALVDAGHTADMELATNGYNQWTAPWAGQAIDSELLHALSSIAPNVLRPNLITLRPNPSYTSPLPSGDSSTLAPAGNGTTSASSHDEEGLGPKVKFVNSTVEILQNQIRREEAPKKKRTRTTPEQLRVLQKAFGSDPMPNSSNRLVLAKRLGMNARAVQVWFQNRRAKEKLEAKRAEVGGSSISLSKSPRLSHPSHSHHPHHHHHQLNQQRAASMDSATDAFYYNGLSRQRHLFHPNHQLVIPGTGGEEGELTDYFMNDASGNFGSSLYHNYGMEPMVAVSNTEIFPAEHDSVAGDGSNDEGECVGGGPDMSPSNYLRFHSYPGALDFNSSANNGGSGDAMAGGNSLGLIFDLPQSSPDKSDSPSSGGASNHCNGYYQRCNSVDVLGRMMGDVEDHDGDDECKIFCNPTSGEAFLGGVGSLGQSIPMPKGRSFSVPDIPLLSSRSQSEIPAFIRNAELMAIKEEEVSTIPTAMAPSALSKCHSIAGLPSASLLSPFVGMPDLLSMDSDMNSLPPWTTDL